MRRRKKLRTVMCMAPAGIATDQRPSAIYRCSLIDSNNKKGCKR